MENSARVLLIGMMGAGKTTVGRALATLTGWPYLDNDELLERAAGRRASEVLETGDEARLRRLEADALNEALAAAAPAVAGVAAGAVLDPAARHRMHEEAFVVYLRAPLELLRTRVADDDPRPWLDDDPAAALERLAEGRDQLYLETAHLVLDVDDHSPHDLAARIVAALDG